jgi:hypothetical protein
MYGPAVRCKRLWSTLVAAFRERIAGADRGHHGARDDRADARDRHQSLAAFVLPSQRFDLAGETLNARVQEAPVCRQIFEDAQHAWRERIASRRQIPGNSARRKRSPCRTAIPRSNMKARI